MSLDDLKAINWKHTDLNSIPHYILLGFGLMLIGVLFIVAGLVF